MPAATAAAGGQFHASRLRRHDDPYADVTAMIIASQAAQDRLNSPTRSD